MILTGAASAHRAACASAMLLLLLLLVAASGAATPAQTKPEQSIGGKEHDDNILGVRLGMDVPTALRAVFEHTATRPAPSKPDALKAEGVDKRDIRVVYKKLKEGELQIVFAGGKSGFVKEATIIYARKYHFSDLQLMWTGDIGRAIGGQRYDDRYIIGYTEESAARRHQLWYREEKTASGYRARVQFTAGKEREQADGQFIERKAIFVAPGDDEKFLKAVGLR